MAATNCDIEGVCSTSCDKEYSGRPHLLGSLDGSGRDIDTPALETQPGKVSGIIATSTAWNNGATVGSALKMSPCHAGCCGAQTQKAT
jgi:hypothetical protein